MSDAADYAIRIDDLAKQFRVRRKLDPDAPRGWAARGAELRKAFREMLHGPDSQDLFWALQGVSFSIRPGEVAGIIGPNGAGKSTLLKILSRIVMPTRGSVRVRGRIASMLEVGTGFHPELTGRENVYMNAAILGMKRRQIQQRFDAIVDFSGVERFIDTPIKHYSSGMKVRLGFAVAAHLDPDILVIDEVLAVGDAIFQKKCLSRIESAGSGGATVLFVSHHLATVSRLCQRVIVLNAGAVHFDGGSLEGIREYEQLVNIIRTVREWPENESPGDAVARLIRVEVIDGTSPAAGSIDIRHPVGLRLRYRVLDSGHLLEPGLMLTNGSGESVFSTFDLDPRWHNRPRPAGDYESTAWIPPNFLNDGTYSVTASLATLEPLKPICFERDCVAFSMADPLAPDTARGHYPGEMPGAVRPILKWDTHRL